MYIRVILGVSNIWPVEPVDLACELGSSSSLWSWIWLVEQTTSALKPGGK